MDVQNAGLRSPIAHSAGVVAETRNPRLEHSAHEFEASLMAELLKPLQEGDGLTGEESDAAAGSGGALAGFASESLARALSERGGFGIADRILKQLEPAGKVDPKDSTAQGLKFSARPPI
jgi:Rod binding domain-containing protein